MPNDLPDGVTRLRSTADIFNIPDLNLHRLFNEAVDLIDRANARNYKPSSRSNLTKGLVGEYKALKYALKTMPKGTEVVWVPARNVNVGILDVLVAKPDGSLVVIEAKYQADGGKPKLGRTNGYIFKVDDKGSIRRIKIKGGNEQLSKGWLQSRIKEIRKTARKLPGPDRRAAKQLAIRLEQALKTGKVEALGIAVDQNGRVVQELDRTNALRNIVASDADDLADAATPKARGTDGKATGKATKGTAGKGTGNGTKLSNKPTSTTKFGPPKTADTLADFAPKARTRASRVALKFDAVSRVKPGFTGNLVLEAAKIVLFSVLQGKLDRVNAEMAAYHYASEIYHPYLSPLIEDAIRVAKNGELYATFPKSRKQWIYLYHEYDILMDQQANTAADAIVIIASGFSVPEVSAGIDVDPDSGFLSRRFDAPLFTTHTVDKRRRTDKKNIVSYRHHRYQLIHSPYVMKVYKTLIRIRNSAIAKLNALAAHFQSGPATAWVAKSGQGFANMINDFSFLQAKTLLDGLGATILSPYRKEVSAISADLAYGDLLLVLVQFRQDDEVGLLNGYLGIDPHVSRKKAQKLLSDLEARERKRKIEEIMRKGGIEMW